IPLGVVAAFLTAGFGRRDGRDLLQDLIVTVGKQPTRPIESRPSGFRYGLRPVAARGVTVDAVSLEVRVAAARIEKLAGERDLPEVRAALGVAYLAIGELEKSVLALEEVAARQPDNGTFQNDLSAAYLARAAAESREEDLPKALAAAERALAGDSGRVEALFNRALALEAMHLDEPARTAWERFR